MNQTQKHSHDAIEHRIIEAVRDLIAHDFPTLDIEAIDLIADFNDYSSSLDISSLSVEDFLAYLKDHYASLFQQHEMSYYM